MVTKEQIAEALAYAEGPVSLATLYEQVLAEAYREAVEALTLYGVHDNDYVAGQWHAGRPTSDGGYESLYGRGERAKWYPRGEAPPCTCGLDAVLAKAPEVSP